MTASPDSLQQRYEAIERVYSERQWDNVARLSEELLLALPNEPSHPLRQRLQLLLGHTYLYGYRDATTASGFYRRVRAATGEPVLRDIADQGLEQCASQAAAPAEPAFAAGAVDAMPWMEQLGGSDPAALLVEVLDEPELVEVAQANPARAEELEVAVREGLPAAVGVRPSEPITSPSPEEIAELSKGLLRVVIR
jgi:hypothetical protein